MKYIKKPVTIEAIQMTGDNTIEILEFMNTEKNPEVILSETEKFITDKIIIPTLEGKMEAKKGDWIIKGINGEFYPCKPDIFEKTYTKFEESHIGRMKIEVQELEEKYKKLHEFMVTKEFCGLEKYQRQLIASQEMLMEGYIDILHKRIEIDEKIKSDKEEL